MSAKRRTNQYTAQEVRALLQADDDNSFSKRKKTDVVTTSMEFSGARRSRRQTAGIARRDPMYVTFPLQNKQHTLPLLSAPTEVESQSVTTSQPVEDAIDQENCLPSQPAVEVAVDEVGTRSVIPSQPVEDADNQEDCLPSQPIVEVGVDEVNLQSVTTSQPMEDAVDQENCLPLQPAVEVAVDEVGTRSVIASQPVKETDNQEDCLPSQPIVEVGVDEVDLQSVTPSQPMEDAVDQENCLPSQPAVEVAVDEVGMRSVIPSQPVKETDNQEHCLPSQPVVEVLVAEANPQSTVLTVQQQSDGNCIISLPDDFIGEAVVNINHASSEVVSNRLNADVSARTDDDWQAPVAVIVEQEISDHNSDDTEENVAVRSPPSASRKRQRRSQTWQKNQRKMKRTKGEQYVSDTTHKVVKARCVKPIDCSKCRLKCSEKVSEEQRQALFAEFYALNSWEAQTAYIVQSIMQFEPARRATKSSQSDNGPRKTQSRAYYMTVSDESSSKTI